MDPELNSVLIANGTPGINVQVLLSWPDIFSISHLNNFFRIKFSFQMNVGSLASIDVFIKDIKRKEKRFNFVIYM